MPTIERIAGVSTDTPTGIGMQLFAL